MVTSQLCTPMSHLRELPAAPHSHTTPPAGRSPLPHILSPSWAQGHLAIEHAFPELGERVRGMAPVHPGSSMSFPPACPALQWDRKCLPDTVLPGGLATQEIVRSILGRTSPTSTVQSGCLERQLSVGVGVLCRKAANEGRISMLPSGNRIPSSLANLSLCFRNCHLVG